MAKSWTEILDVGDRELAPTADAGVEPEERSGVFRRLRESLSKSRQALTEEISASLFDRIDEETWEQLEEALILADAGATVTAQVVERLEQDVDSGAVAADGVAVQERLIEILAEIATTGRPTINLTGEPVGAADGRRQRHGEDDDDRQDRLAPEQGARPVGGDGRGGHLPRRGRRAARGVGAARRRRARASPSRAATRARSPSTRSRRPRRAAPMS